MKAILEPTPETHTFTINDVEVPTRIWTGYTDSGLPIEAYVLSIVPAGEDNGQLAREVPSFMRRSRDSFKIGLPNSDEEKHS